LLGLKQAMNLVGYTRELKMYTFFAARVRYESGK
jgi:hypothetical protein